MVALVMMRVDVDDEDVLVAPADRLLPRVGQHLALAEFRIRSRIANDRFARVHFFLRS